MPDPAPSAAADRLAACERVLDHAFRDRGHLRAALTHASGADHKLLSNERLEFLGDAVLGAIVCERLYRSYPDYLEGDLTRIKSVVVSRQTCAKLARLLGLDAFLIVGKGMGAQDQTPSSILSNAFESLIGALYLDGGIETARSFIDRHVGPEIDRAVADNAGQNDKSLLQQTSQKRFGSTPTYFLVDEKGPDHSKCFKIAAQIGPQRYSPAWGITKKDAEQRAATNALREIDGGEPPYRAI